MFDNLKYLIFLLIIYRDSIWVFNEPLWPNILPQSRLELNRFEFDPNSCVSIDTLRGSSEAESRNRVGMASFFKFKDFKRRPYLSLFSEAGTNASSEMFKKIYFEIIHHLAR